MKKDKRELHNFTVLIEKDEDGMYVATVPALKSCYTQAKTLEELYQAQGELDTFKKNPERNSSICFVMKRS